MEQRRRVGMARGLGRNALAFRLQMADFILQQDRPAKPPLRLLPRGDLHGRPGMVGRRRQRAAGLPVLQSTDWTALS